MNINCNHQFTSLARENDEEDALTWEWCIRCGSLKLGDQIHSLGEHQTLLIIADRVR